MTYLIAKHWFSDALDYYAAALISDAMALADLAFLPTASHHCPPAAASCFCAVDCLLTPSERSTNTGCPWVLGQLERPLHEMKAVQHLVCHDVVGSSRRRRPGGGRSSAYLTLANCTAS